MAAKDVDHQYFSLIEQPIIEGDNFTEADIKDDNLVMVINDVLAKQIAVNGSAIGVTFKNGVRVIGVVKSINRPGRKLVEPRFYYPSRLTRNMLLIKAKTGQTFSKEEMLLTLKTVDKKLNLFSFYQIEELKNQYLFASKTTAITTVILTLLTLFLSGLGLYGILNYSSQMRRFEIGTRMAIGAKGKDIVRMIFRDNAGALLIGIMISILVLLGLYLGFSESLTSFISLELLPLLIITLALISLLCFLACYLPLRQYINKPTIHSLRGVE